MKTNSKKAFTLIETLVAIAIFAFCITGLISVTARGVFSANFVKNKFTASYLALEGAELVRNIRDSQSINGATWTDIFGPGGTFGQCDNVNFCQIDADVGTAPLTVVDCNEDCDYMNFNQDSARFNYAFPGGSNAPSIFKRIIYIEPVNNSPGSAEEVRVTSRVEWGQGSNLHSVNFYYDLLNWTGN